MRVYRSNRMEKLSEALAEVLQTPISGATPLQAMTQREIVVVHSQGMARWLSMELARRLKVCANIDFPFPKTMVRQSVGAVLGEQEDAWKVWRPDAMLWGTLRALDAHLDEPAFAPLASYLSERHESADPRRALGHVDAVLLAREIADIFDRYISYRPDVIARWDLGEGGADDWQPTLWRTLKAQIDTPHLGAMVQDLDRALRQGCSVDPQRLPPRICLFGISTLPPFYLDLFGALSRLREIHLFILCPSSVYWADIRSKREQARELRRLERTHQKPADVGELHLEEGNPLLASFGRLGRDFQVVLEGRDASTHYQEAEGDLFVDPAEGEGSLLHTLQSDILSVRRRAHEGDVPPITLASDDRSVSVHACYGAMRQVEALRDDLIERLASDPTLEPRDIVVMTPEVERFAPIVEAVFGDQGATPELPYRIADRALAKENPVAEVLDRVLTLATQRLTGAELLDLVSLPTVQRRFGLHEDDLPTLKEWIQESGIRWGIDAEDRERHDQPGYSLNTWRFGLDRMLLGVAMIGQERDTFGGVLPYDEIEGADATTLGRLADTCEALFTSIEALRSPRSMGEWVETLKALIERMTAVKDQDAWRVQQLHEALDELGEEAHSAPYEGPLDRAAIHALIKRRLDNPRRAAGFLTGAITVCAMVPMRSVPFRVVALLGMDEESFPRKARGLGFDLTWRHPRIGDRNPREEDRYLMLEALLAARDALVVTYNGRDPQTGEVKAPAAPIDELLEVIRDTADLPEALHPIVVAHPLHPFSPSLFGVEQRFDEEGLAVRIKVPPRSHDTRRLAAAAQMLKEPTELPSLVRGAIALESAHEALLEVSLSTLIDFYKNPSKGFLYRRLGVYLEESDDALKDREPTHLAQGLEQWAVREAALSHALEGGSAEEVYTLMRLKGTLPLGVPGRIAFDQATVQVPDLVDTRNAHAVGASRTVAIDLTLGRVRLTGQVSDVYDSGRVIAQASGGSAKHEVGLWLTHLALRATETVAPMPSTLVRKQGGGAAVLALGTTMSAQEARAHLQKILGDYRRGQEVPLCFFPQTSKAYASSLYEAEEDAEPAKKEALALVKAAEAWRREPGAEADDPYTLTLHAKGSPFSPDYTLPQVSETSARTFSALAQSFWTPFLKEIAREVGS